MKKSGGKIGRNVTKEAESRGHVITLPRSRRHGRRHAPALTKDVIRDLAGPLCFHGSTDKCRHLAGERATS